MIAFPPMTPRLVRALLASAVLAALTVLRAGAQAAAPRDAELSTTDAVLAAYLAGDPTVLERVFKTSVDFQKRLKLNEPKELDRWLGEFNPAKAVFVLSLAERATIAGLQFTPVLLSAGERYVDGDPTRGRNARVAAPAEFALAWNRAAVTLLQRVRNDGWLQAHLAAIERSRQDILVDARLLLAKGIAKELQCWHNRPTLDQPSMQLDALAKEAGVVIKNDLAGPRKAERTEAVRDHFVCQNEALARFDAARGAAESRAEAGVRGGWLLVQQERFADAMAWLDVTIPDADRELAYWRSLFRGRALHGLKRHREAADAYRDAFRRFPGAQTAGLGVALELGMLDRDEEADQIVRSLRLTAVTAPDPWTTYMTGEGRYAAKAVAELRKKVIQ